VCLRPTSEVNQPSSSTQASSLTNLACLLHRAPRREFPAQKLSPHYTAHLRLVHVRLWFVRLFPGILRRRAPALQRVLSQVQHREVRGCRWFPKCGHECGFWSRRFIPVFHGYVSEVSQVDQMQMLSPCPQWRMEWVPRRPRPRVGLQ